jgi:hypothetical protein
VVSVVAQLLEPIYSQDSDAWFEIVGIQKPSDSELETFLDLTEKAEDLAQEIEQSLNSTLGNVQLSSSRQKQLAKELAKMLTE